MHTITHKDDSYTFTTDDFSGLSKTARKAVVKALESAPHTMEELAKVKGVSQRAITQLEKLCDDLNDEEPDMSFDDLMAMAAAEEQQLKQPEGLEITDRVVQNARMVTLIFGLYPTRKAVDHESLSAVYYVVGHHKYNKGWKNEYTAHNFEGGWSMNSMFWKLVFEDFSDDSTERLANIREFLENMVIDWEPAKQEDGSIVYTWMLNWEPEYLQHNRDAIVRFCEIAHTRFNQNKVLLEALKNREVALDPSLKTTWTMKPEERIPRLTETKKRAVAYRKTLIRTDHAGLVWTTTSDFAMKVFSGKALTKQWQRNS